MSKLLKHTKANWGYKSRYVKCAESHPSSTCKNSHDSPATCVLYLGSYPENYKRCSIYKRLLRQKSSSQKIHQKASNDTLLTSY